jgi:hypothetical protein
MASLETGNAAFANDFSSWILQESGVVKVVSSTHHRDDETEPRDQYTKKDPVVSPQSHTSSADGQGPGDSTHPLNMGSYTGEETMS